MDARRLLMTLLAAAVLAVAGCGGDGDDGSSDTGNGTTAGSATGADGSSEGASQTGADAAEGTDGANDAGSSTATAGVPTKAEYITRADEICRKAEEEFARTLNESFEDGSPGQAEPDAALETAFVENLEGQLNDLRALNPPAGDEQTLAAMYDSLAVAVQEIAEDPSSLTEPSAAMKDASRRARAYGLDECGS